MRLRWGLALLTVAAAGCSPAPDDAAAGGEAFSPRYLGVQIDPLDRDLIGFTVTMRGARDAKDVADYARCAAAGHARDRGFGFVRHVRTKVDEEGGVWRADAVYTFSSALPGGLRTIDAEVTLADCEDRGIPAL